MRIKINLEHFFKDHRRLSLIEVDAEALNTVEKVLNWIAVLFKLPLLNPNETLGVFLEDCFIHPGHSSSILFNHNDPLRLRVVENSKDDSKLLSISNDKEDICEASKNKSAKKKKKKRCREDDENVSFESSHSSKISKSSTLNLGLSEKLKKNKDRDPSSQPLLKENSVNDQLVDCNLETKLKSDDIINTSKHVDFIYDASVECETDSSTSRKTKKKRLRKHSGKKDINDVDSSVCENSKNNKSKFSITEEVVKGPQLEGHQDIFQEPLPLNNRSVVSNEKESSVADTQIQTDNEVEFLTEAFPSILKRKRKRKHNKRKKAINSSTFKSDEKFKSDPSASRSFNFNVNQDNGKRIIFSEESNIDTDFNTLKSNSVCEIPDCSTITNASNPMKSLWDVTDEDSSSAIIRCNNQQPSTSTPVANNFDKSYFNAILPENFPSQLVSIVPDDIAKEDFKCLLSHVDTEEVSIFNYNNPKKKEKVSSSSSFIEPSNTHIEKLSPPNPKVRSSIFINSEDSETFSLLLAMEHLNDSMIYEYRPTKRDQSIVQQSLDTVSKISAVKTIFSNIKDNSKTSDNINSSILNSKSEVIVSKSKRKKSKPRAFGSLGLFLSRLKTGKINIKTDVIENSTEVDFDSNTKNNFFNVSKNRNFSSMMDSTFDDDRISGQNNSDGMNTTIVNTESKVQSNPWDQKNCKKEIHNPCIYSSSTLKVENVDNLGESGMIKKEPMNNEENGHPLTKLPENSKCKIDFSQYPLMNTLPTKKEIIAVKFLEKDNHCSPSFSNYKFAKTLEVNGFKVSFQIINDNEVNNLLENKPMSQVTDIITMDWNEVHQPRLVYP